MKWVGSVLLLSFANAPHTHAQTPSAQPRFEVASVKPAGSGVPGFGFQPGGRFRATGVTLKLLILAAYRVPFFEISGGPDWLNSARFDVNAKAAGEVDQDRGALMLQALLEDRFQLKAHRETKDLPIYALVPAKNGPRLRDSKGSACTTYDFGNPQSQEPRHPCRTLNYGNRIVGGKVSMKELADMLSQLPELGRRVVDKTGLTGTWDLDLQWAPAGAGAGDQTSGPSIFTALPEQLGLRLESQKGPVEMFVIDRAEKPTEN